MASPLKTPVAGLAAFAAFGVASLGALSAAAAHPAPPVPGDDTYEDRPDDYDLDNDGILEHVEIDYRHYDTDRDGTLDPAERTAYWKHMFDMGQLGSGFNPADKERLARIAYVFDRDGDGRLTQDERVAISRLVRARRLFNELDRNNDNSITRREAGLSPRGYGYGGGYGAGYGHGAGYGAGYGSSYGAGSTEYGVAPGHYREDRDVGYGLRSGGFFYWARPRTERFRASNWIAARFETLDTNDNGRVTWNEIESRIVLGFRRGTRP